MYTWPDKDPVANKDYSIDWSGVLKTDEVITESIWSVFPGDELIIGVNLIIGSVCTVWLSEGALGTQYTLVNEITTDRGLVDKRSVFIKITQQ